MPDSVNASDPSKSAFLEFGHGHPAHQQHSPGLSHIYPVHGLHAAGHSQHESPFPGSASYGRALGYAYPGAVNTRPPSAYLPYQHSNHSSSLAHSRLEQTGMWKSQIEPKQTVLSCVAWTFRHRHARAHLRTGAHFPWHFPGVKNSLPEAIHLYTFMSYIQRIIIKTWVSDCVISVTV